ncbi:MAG: hypothetical protein IJ527_01370 [Prevotella sp.]|nr:hypothetical protein [Prevotella sp.]
MKKKYCLPTLQVVHVSTQQVLATSSFSISDTETDIQFARELDFDSEEE